MDITAAPLVTDITVNGKKIKAVSVVSKQGFTYVFDRVTGNPVWPMEERPVPQTDVPGEKTAATQPFPTKPPAFEKQGTSIDDAIDFTPAIKARRRRSCRSTSWAAVYASHRGRYQWQEGNAAFAVACGRR